MDGDDSLIKDTAVNEAVLTDEGLDTILNLELLDWDVDLLGNLLPVNNKNDTVRKLFKMSIC